MSLHLKVSLLTSLVSIPSSSVRWSSFLSTGRAEALLAGVWILAPLWSLTMYSSFKELWSRVLFSHIPHSYTWMSEKWFVEILGQVNLLPIPDSLLCQVFAENLSYVRWGMTTTSALASMRNSPFNFRLARGLFSSPCMHTSRKRPLLVYTMILKTPTMPWLKLVY